MSDTLSKKYYTISHASRRLGVSKATLRRWEKEGKISSTIDENGIHIYSDESLKAHAHTPQPTASDTLPTSPMTPAEVAKWNSISQATLTRWEKAGLIESTRTAGGARRYNPEDVGRLLSSRAPYQRVPKDKQLVQKVSKIYTQTHPIATQAPVSVPLNDIMTYHREIPLPEEPTPLINPLSPPAETPEHSDTSPPTHADPQPFNENNQFTKPLFLTGVLLLGLAGAGFLAVHIAGVRSNTQKSPPGNTTASHTAVASLTKETSSSTQGNVLGTSTAKTIGAAGGTGTVGPTGVIGPTGETGLSGLIGIPGPTGIMGFIGASGATGPTGYAGPAGGAGVLGAVGATGGTGQIGANGEVLFTQNDAVIFPYAVVDKSIALGNTAGSGLSTTTATSALIFLSGTSGNASISGLLTMRGGDSIIETQTMSKLTIGSATTGAIQLSPNGTSGLLVSDQGFVGIGTTPSYPLDVKAAGTGIIARFNSENATGCSLAADGTLSCTSDERLKKNIENIGVGIDTLMALRPVTFDWKNLSSPYKNLGFIAQEIESILPELVTTDEVTGYKQLNMTGLIPVLTHALQQQQKQIASLSQSFAQKMQEPFTSPLAGVEEVKTNILSPLSDTAKGIDLKLGDHQSFSIYNKEGRPTTSFDALGNLDIKGNLDIQGNLKATSVYTGSVSAFSASVAGTLYADRIVTRFGEITPLPSGNSPPTTAQDFTPIPLVIPDSIGDDTTLISSTSALAALGVRFSGDNFQNVIIEKDILLTESFTAFGDTFLGNTTVGGSLVVNGSVHISEDGIETYGSIFRIQPKKLAALDIMGGTIIVSNTGSVIFNGNVNIIGELAATEGISTSILSPFGQDLTINLSKSLQTTSVSASSSGELALNEVEGARPELAEGFGKLLIQGRGGYTVSSFDSLGNATLAGTLRTSELLADKIHMALYPESTASGTFIPSIGTAVLPAGESSITVENESVTDESLVFITPTSPTGNTLYVVDRIPGEFIVGITAPPLEDIRFNWWIIN